MIRFSLSNYKYSILNKPMVFYNIDNHPSKSKKFIRYLKSNLRFYKKYFFNEFKLSFCKFKKTSHIFLNIFI